MTIHERLMLLRKGKGLSQQAVANQLNMTRSAVSMYETGKRVPDLETLERLCDLYSVSMDELTGRAPLGRFVMRAPTVAEEVVVFFPIGTVAAGYDELAFEDYGTDPVEIPRKYLAGRPASDYFVLTIHGDSMYPGFLDGDKVLVLKQPTLDKSGDIGVILYEGDIATLKRVEFVPGEDWMKLIPTNPEYQPKLITGAELEQCRVIGVPRLLIREVR